MEIKTGDQYIEKYVFDKEEVLRFSALTGDDNPIHIDIDYVKNKGFRSLIVPGMLIGGVFSRIFGTIFPGKGSIYLEQDLKFLAPIEIGKKVFVLVEVTDILNCEKGIYKFRTYCQNDKKEVLTDGYAIIKYNGGL